jgi:hypothetical protein
MTMHIKILHVNPSLTHAGMILAGHGSSIQYNFKHKTPVKPFESRPFAQINAFFRPDIIINPALFDRI